MQVAANIPNQHPWTKLTGITRPDQRCVRIECKCGHVSEAPTFRVAMRAHEKHQGITR